MKRNLLTVVGAVFSVVGLFVLFGAGYFFNETQTFIGRSQQATGTVVDFVSQTSRSSANGTYSTSYFPVVKFKDNSDREIEFHSSSGSNPPAYKEGDIVAILYDPANPRKAEINTFFDLWGAALLLGSMGFGFSLLGGVILTIAIRKARQIKWLKQYGRTILADFSSVSVNHSVSIRGRHPFTIFAQWTNPANGKVYIFHSENIWYDPEKMIDKAQKIKILIDPANPRKHYLDISFLPKEGS